MFRGFVLYGALTQFRVWAAILFASIIFGSVHVLNGVTTGDFTGSTIQAIAAGISGFWFAAIRLRTKSIYPGMILHALWDCGLFLILVAVAQAAQESSAARPHQTFGAMSVIRPILFELPLFLYALWLLRGVGDKTKEELLGLDESLSAV